MAFLEEINRYDQPNPWLPRIFSVDVYMDNHAKTSTVVKMERLESKWQAFGDAKPGYESLFAKTQEIRSHACKYEQYDWITNNSRLVQALDLIERAQKRSRCNKDLHGNNMMMRGQHQIVITDPLGFPE
jgi:hypothetical protein